MLDSPHNSLESGTLAGSQVAVSMPDRCMEVGAGSQSPTGLFPASEISAGSHGVAASMALTNAHSGFGA